MWVYVGCYTTPDRGGRGRGIVAYQMDAASGAWSGGHLVAEVPNPSYLALDPAQEQLYCVHGGNDYSAVSAFAIDRASGQLTYINRQETGGPNPVALAIEPSGQLLAVANYSGGTVAALPVRPDGAVGPLRTLFTLTGERGPHPTEQTRSHPHDSVFDPSGQFLVVPDKGFDRLFVFRVDAAQQQLVRNDPPFVPTRSGAGPRHIAFHPREPYAYVINELNSTITTYAYDGEHGTLLPLQVIATLPTTFEGKSATSEIVIAPSGRFLYGSNRGHDSIAIFAINQGNGTLASLGWAPTQGRTPRFIALSPDGAFLYAANQESDTIVTFRVDPEWGTLTLTGQTVRTGSPVTMVFVGE